MLPIGRSSGAPRMGATVAASTMCPNSLSGWDHKLYWIRVEATDGSLAVGRVKSLVRVCDIAASGVLTFGVDRGAVCCWECRAPTLMYATSAVGGSSGVVRAAVKAKGRVPS